MERAFRLDPKPMREEEFKQFMANAKRYGTPLYSFEMGGSLGGACLGFVADRDTLEALSRFPIEEAKP